LSSDKAWLEGVSTYFSLEDGNDAVEDGRARSVDALDEVMAGSSVVEVFVFDKDITEILADMTLEFIGSSVANLDCKSVSRLFESLDKK